MSVSCKKVAVGSTDNRKLGGPKPSEALSFCTYACLFSSCPEPHHQDLVVVEFSCLFLQHPCTKALVNGHWKKKLTGGGVLLIQGQREMTTWSPSSKDVKNLFLFFWARCRPSCIPSGVLAGANFSREVFLLSHETLLLSFSPHQFLNISSPNSTEDARPGCC